MREAQQKSEDDEERSSRQRRAQEQGEREEQHEGLGGSHGLVDTQKNWDEEPRSGGQRRQEQSESEPTQAAGAGTERTQQREERAPDGNNTSSRKRKGKEKMSTHQLKQMDEQQTRATRTASSDKEEETDERRRRKQRGHEDSHNQPNVQRKAPQATQEDDGSATPEDIEPHEMARIQAVSSGGVTVNESVCVRKNPTRGARPQREAEAKKPVRKKATKGPIFKGTYLQRMGAAGGQLKFMIRLGERAIERMEGTYEKAKPPRRGHER